MPSAIELSLKNLFKYNYVFPWIRYCNEDRYIAPWQQKRRFIEDYELMLITKGTGQFTIGEITYDVNPNDLLLFKPDIFHQGRSITLPFEFFCLHFDLYIAGETPNELPTEPVFYQKAVIDFPTCSFIEDAYSIQYMFKNILKEAQLKYPDNTIPLRSLFMVMLSEIIRHVYGDFSEKKVPRAVQQITEYVKNNYMKPIHLDELSALVHLEKTYVSSIFKKYLNTTISDYIRAFRLSIAKELLLETDCKLEDIAQNTGFYDLHYLSRTFKQIEGISPSQYRKIKKY